jgi:hypothetical protein
MGITPPFIAPIRLPKTPKTPRIAAMPGAASNAPKDADLFKELKALALPETPLLLASYEAFGKTTLFEARLLEVLRALPFENVDDRLWIHLARLGAEAYVLDIEITGLSRGLSKVNVLGFISSIDDLPGRRPEMWSQFVMRRLVERSEVELTGDETHVQLHKSIDFLQFVQDEHARTYPLIIASQHTLEEYRRVLFKILQKHYQALFDGMFAKGSGTRYRAVLKQLENNLHASLALTRDVDPAPMVNAFRIKKMTFQDYFDPKDKTDVRFAFFGKSAPPIAREGPELAFRSVLEKRYRQHQLLDDLRPGARSPTSPAFPEPPALHDNKSWQIWARSMWSGMLSREDHDKTFEKICGYISRYFHALSAHMPYDLEEGSKTKSYLTRPFPRAITGGLVHDCLVYAIRWIHILGRLLEPSTMPSALSDPRIWLVEMPAHVGVMIRVRIVPTVRKQEEDILIAINNQNAAVMRIETDTSDEEAADQVVGKMYEGLDTPVIITKITAKPTDARALWPQISRISDAKSVLPYDHPDEPVLRYLEFTAENARIVKDLKDALVPPFQRMREALDRIPARAEARRRAYASALETYKKEIAEAFDAAKADTEKAIRRIAHEINSDISTHMTNVERTGATIARFGDITNWDHEKTRYEVRIEEAKANLDLLPLDPEVAFGRDELLMAARQ